MKTVLFVCVHNSARSQMAEAFVNQMCDGEWEAHSAGLEPGTLNPLVVQTMQEIGFDLSANQTKSVEDMIKTGRQFDYVITVCDGANAERCPIVPGKATRLHWSFSDPSGFQGAQEDKLAKTRAVRDSIRQQIEQWCSEVCCVAAP